MGTLGLLRGAWWSAAKPGPGKMHRGLAGPSSRISWQPPALGVPGSGGGDGHPQPAIWGRLWVSRVGPAPGHAPCCAHRWEVPCTASESPDAGGHKPGALAWGSGSLLVITGGLRWPGRGPALGPQAELRVELQKSLLCSVPGLGEEEKEDLAFSLEGHRTSHWTCSPSTSRATQPVARPPPPPGPLLPGTRLGPPGMPSRGLRLGISRRPAGWDKGLFCAGSRSGCNSSQKARLLLLKSAQGPLPEGSSVCLLEEQPRAHKPAVWVLG